MPDPMIGTAIGRFVIRRKLAEGGMGAVYLAVHERLAVRKVVKVLLAEYSRNATLRQRFEREATAASRLAHRNIIQIDDFGALPDGQLFLMMPFLDGESLEAHLRRDPRPTLHHAFHILVQICRALEHLHAAGIVHRDLKPGNVFLCATDDNPHEVVLIDLGIARDLEDDTAAFRTQNGMAIGTPGYMAVEQYGNAATAAATADVYAVAIIAWEMLTGQLPWGFHDTRALYMKQMTEVPVPPPHRPLPPELLALLRRALAVDPAARPATARDFAVELAAHVAAEPPHLPSGAEMIARFARELVERASPDRATVRHVAVRPRPALTTLGAANGVAAGRTPRPSRRWLPLAVAGGALAGLATFALVEVRGDSAPARETVSRPDRVVAAPPDAAVPADAAAAQTDAAPGIGSMAIAGAIGTAVTTYARAAEDLPRTRRAPRPDAGARTDVEPTAAPVSRAPFDPDAVEE